MTTRPTDEEIRAVSERLNRHINTGSYDLDVMQLAADYLNAWIAERQQDKTESGLVRCFEALGVQPADPGHKWSFLVTEIKRLVERQAARVGITDEMVEKFKAEQSNGMSRYTSAENAMGRTPRMQDAMDYGTRVALQSVAQPVESPLIQYKKISAIYALDCPQGAQSKQESQLADALDSLWDKLTPEEQKDAETFTAKLSKAMLSVSPQPQQALLNGLSQVTLAVIGRKHFGNPIPKEWYAAAKELLSATPAYNGKKDEQ